MRNQTVSKTKTRQWTQGQKHDILTTLIQGLPATMSFDDAKALIGAKGTFLSGVRKAFEPFIRTKTVLYWLDQMGRFYNEVFGFKVDYAKLQVPVSQEGFNWLLVADQWVTTELAAQKCRERFPFWRWTDVPLDKIIVHDDRSEKNGTYAIWLRDTVEADKVHQSKSANDIQATGVKGVTLREQLLLVLWYHWKFGKFLDTINITLCTGSRCGDDRSVPDVSWSPGDRRVRVMWSSPHSSLDYLRCREVVS